MTRRDWIETAVAVAVLAVLLGGVGAAWFDVLPERLIP